MAEESINDAMALPDQRKGNVSLPLINPYGEQYSSSYDKSIVKNLYLVKDETGKYPFAAFPTPGLDLVLTLNASVVRELYVLNNTLLAVASEKVYLIDVDYNTTLIGTLASNAGPCWVVGNTSQGEVNQIMLSDGIAGYVYDFLTATFSAITDPYFLGSSTVTTLNTYAITNNPNLNLFQVCQPNNFLNWNFTSTGGSNVASVDSVPDPIVAVQRYKEEVYVFTTKGVEIWTPNLDTSNPFPFQRRNDVYLTEGCVAAKTIKVVNDSVFWLAQNEYGQGYAVRSYYDMNLARLTTDAIETKIFNYSTISDALAYTMYINGTLFYVLIFPTAEKTWLYNLNNKTWTEWESLETTTGTNKRHLSNCYAVFNGSHLVGDFSSGKIYKLNMNTYTDNGATITRKLVTRHLFKNNKWIYYKNLELNCDVGVGTATGAGENPQIMLQISRDSGQSWGREAWRPVGKVGEYFKRVRWRRCGRAKTFTLQFTMTDPVKWVLQGLTVDYELGDV